MCTFWCSYINIYLYIHPIPVHTPHHGSICAKHNSITAQIKSHSLPRNPTSWRGERGKNPPFTHHRCTWPAPQTSPALQTTSKSPVKRSVQQKHRFNKRELSSRCLCKYAEEPSEFNRGSPAWLGLRVPSRTSTPRQMTASSSSSSRFREGSDSHVASFQQHNPTAQEMLCNSLLQPHLLGIYS